VVLWAVTIAAAWFGTENARENLAPVLVYVVLWVGMQGTSAVLGDVWRALSPFDTIAAVAQSLRTRTRPHRVIEARDDGSLVRSHWPAVLGVFGFTWLELCYHSPSEPRVLAVVMTTYSAVVLAGAARFGRTWLRTGETFAVLFGLLALISPFFRDDDGRLRVRRRSRPRTQLAPAAARWRSSACCSVRRASTASAQPVVKGIVGDSVGWDRTLINTLGMVWIIGIVIAAYVAASMERRTSEGWTAPRQRFVASLVPIALAPRWRTTSLFTSRGPERHALITATRSAGWDLFGTATNVVDLAIVSTSTIAWVQVGAIVIGHRRRGRRPRPRRRGASARLAVRSQYPMLLVMIAYTVGRIGAPARRIGQRRPAPRCLRLRGFCGSERATVADEPPRNDADRPNEWVLHVDLDQFLAAVEILRHPELAGRPLVVGGDGDPTRPRQVVATASYEARAFGVRSGMPLRTAARRCPDAVFLPSDRAAYDAASARVMATLRSLPVVVEVWGWDEAFLGTAPPTPRLAGVRHRCSPIPG
jgi:hypothetical protein